MAAEFVPEVAGLDTALAGEADAEAGLTAGFATALGLAAVEEDASPEPTGDLTGATGFKAGFGAAAGVFGP